MAAQDTEATTVDEWIIEMERPFVLPGKKARPTPREMEIEADGFAALYAQVNGS